MTNGTIETNLFDQEELHLALKDWNKIQTSLRTDPWKEVEVIS